VAVDSMTAKSCRLLADARVQILFATEHVVTARVRGDSGIYDVSWDRNGGRWSCTCAAFGDSCSHVEAVRSVTTKGLK
jgi:uncharacterized Zn finger protein